MMSNTDISYKSCSSKCRDARDKAGLCCLGIPEFCDRLWTWATGRTQRSAYARHTAGTSAELRTEQPSPDVRPPAGNDVDAFLDVDPDSLAAALE